ncbi:ZmpA/ZmpB/ZmpC family metallo-endopeptidase, partial [Streptococcus pneumoniae]
VNNVYYNFNELVKDMQANPTGEFKLGADLNAANVKPNGKSYVTKPFKGKLLSNDGGRFTIHNIERPLFANIEGGKIHDINLANVNINMPWADKVAPIANVIKNNATIENVKVTGNVLGKDWVSGFIDKIDGSGKLINVAFIGNVTSVGTGGNFLTGIVGENWKGYVERAYVDAHIKGKRAKAAGIAYWSQNQGNNFTIGSEGAIKKSVVKGTIDVEKPIEVGGAVGSFTYHGSIEDTVSMMKVKNGEIFYGSKDIDDDPYYTGNHVNRNYVVIGVSEGTSTYRYSNQHNRIKPITQSEADVKIAETAITADKFTITDPIVNKLNALTTRDNEYRTTQDYEATREQAYRNIEKLQPFYNKEWIVNQGNKLVEGSNLLTKEVLSVTGIKSGQFVTDLSDIDKIMIHYSDGAKEELNVTRQESNVQQVREYSITDLDILYTPNMVEKDRAQLMTDVKSKLSSVELESDGVRQLLVKRDTKKDANANSVGRQNGYIRDLFLEESFSEVKANLDKLVKQILENEDHQLNDNELAERALLKKVEDNKAKIMMGLAYLNQYYAFKYDELSIKDIMMFKPDFYGKTASVIDRLINIGSAENNLKGDRTQDAYRGIISGATGKGSLHDFLTYNMKLFTNETDINVWFKKAIEKNAYVVEQPSTNPAFANKKYRLYEGINNGQHGRMILPLLNLKNAHLFMISTYNTISFSSFEKYGKDTDEKREKFKSEINKRAKEQVNYLDFWSRLATDNVRDKLLKSQNVVPTPVWDNHNSPNGWASRHGHIDGKPDYAPIREFFGRINKYHGYKYGYGAYAYIFAAPQPMDAVYFVMTDLISDFGTSAFTHETTHVNDRMAYYGGHWHREGTDLEAFAQGMLQTPSVSNPNGEYGALGLNMAYERQNDGNQWYNTNPNDLTTRAEIDNYMKGFNDTLMLLDYLEGEAVLNKANQDLNNAWFKKVDKQLRGASTKNQYDKVRDLTADEKNITLNSVDDLVDNNFMTKHGPGNNVYDPTGFGTAYVTVPITAGIYGGNTSEGAPGSMSFKHNTFRMWGYYGYEKGFLNYASNMLKNESRQAGHNTLGDDFIIKKVSDNKFSTLEDWKKAYFKEVVDKAKAGFNPVTIDSTTYSSYDDLKNAFAAAVEKDKATLKNGSVKSDNTVALKEKIYKKLLQQTDSFKTSIFR